MNAKTVRFNAENERSYCFAQYLRRQGGATHHSLPMKQLTAAVLRAELTPLQRFSFQGRRRICQHPEHNRPNLRRII